MIGKGWLGLACLLAAGPLLAQSAAGFQPAMAAFVPPWGSTPAGTPALPARGLLHPRRPSRNLHGLAAIKTIVNDSILERRRKLATSRNLPGTQRNETSVVQPAEAGESPFVHDRSAGWVRENPVTYFLVP
jgi:hypothetical protein